VTKRCEPGRRGNMPSNLPTDAGTRNPSLVLMAKLLQAWTAAARALGCAARTANAFAAQTPMLRRSFQDPGDHANNRCRALLACGARAGHGRRRAAQRRPVRRESLERVLPY